MSQSGDGHPAGTLGQKNNPGGPGLFVGGNRSSGWTEPVVGGLEPEIREIVVAGGDFSVRHQHPVEDGDEPAEQGD